MGTDSNLILADNVRRLMEATGDSQVKVAKRAGLSQRNVGNVMTYGTTHETSPTVRTVDGLAAAFGIPAWLLFVPDVPLELLVSPRLSTLISTYVKISETGRETVDRVASAEERFSEISSPQGKKSA
ncbi:hypothetical protein CEE55_02400 [Stenotrophomonas pavanii]|uniref:HTH cro/C1-type domain-containing protein n=2 Tax=Lysobacteraceae TaxID=32033 RepID=A0A2D0AP11_9GAMM|nr:hypothetical protein CEE55_02400 [Stenotrophomonas pavanii]